MVYCPVCGTDFPQVLGALDGAEVERACLREKVEAMRTAARDRRKNEVLSQTLWDHEGGRIDLADEVLALLEGE